VLAASTWAMSFVERFFRREVQGEAA